MLVPPLWQLSLSHQTRIFQNLSIPNLINEVLKSSGIPINAFDISKLSREEVKRDYTVQHDETDLDFLQRWLEHEGISYWFEDTDQGVKIIFGEQSVHFPQLKGTVSYSHMDNPDDLEKEIEGDFDWYDAGHVVSFNSCRIVVPKTLVLRDYNWQTPSESLEVKKEIYQEGFGIHYEYNNHYQTLMEGVRLGDIRKQEILSRQTVFQGKGTSRLFRAGLVFNLTDHYRDSFNDRHLLTKVVHTAKQEVALATLAVKSSIYFNTFDAIPYAVDRPFRPRRTTPWPRVSGLTTAKVEGPGDEDTLNLDTDGNYRIRLATDRSTTGPGAASKPVRMAQPSAGKSAKMHLPLRTGTEVLLGHENGHPDRPVILGAVPNRDNDSVVNKGNQKDSIIRSTRQSLMGYKDLWSAIRMSDGGGSSAMTLKSGRNCQISMSNLLYTPLDLMSMQSMVNSTNALLSHSITAGYSSGIRAGQSFGILAGWPELQIPLGALLAEVTKQFADRIEDHKGGDQTVATVLGISSTIWTVISLLINLGINTLALKLYLGKQVSALQGDLKKKYKTTRNLFDGAVKDLKFGNFLYVEESGAKSAWRGIRAAITDQPFLHLIKKLKELDPPAPGFSVMHGKGLTRMDTTGGKDILFGTDQGWMRFWCGDEFNVFTNTHFKALFEKTGFIGNRFSQLHLFENGTLTARSGDIQLFLGEKHAKLKVPLAKDSSALPNSFILDGNQARLNAPTIDLHARTEPTFNKKQPKILLSEKGVNIQTGESDHKIILQTKDFSIKIDGEQISLLGKTGGGGITITKDGDITIAGKGEIVLKAPDVKVECCTNMDVSGNLKVAGKLDHPSVSGEPMPPPVSLPVTPPRSSDTWEDTSPDEAIQESEDESEEKVESMEDSWDEEVPGPR
ncbi:MAG: type VI secretion system Vgr family protein [Planctomycetota bacterium]